MVDVRWDFQGAAVDLNAAEQAVGRIVTFHREALDGTVCPIHNREPWLMVKGRTPRDLVVSIGACCDQLLDAAQGRMNGVSRRDQE
jgi:hypothetical protein